MLLIRPVYFTLLLILTVIIMVAFWSVDIHAAGAKDDIEEACRQNPDSSLCTGYNKPGNPGTNNDGVLVGIVNILSYAAGALAVFFLVFGGFKYIKSAGESNKVGEAKQTIVYALVGLVVVVLSRTLVLYILELI